MLTNYGTSIVWTGDNLREVFEFVCQKNIYDTYGKYFRTAFRQSAHSLCLNLNGVTSKISIGTTIFRTSDNLYVIWDTENLFKNNPKNIIPFEHYNGDFSV